MVRSYGHFGLTKYFQDPQEQQEYLQLNPYQERPQPLPYWRGNIQLITPQNFGPMVFGIFRPIGGWKLNILGTYNTGSFATYNPNSTPGIVDNIQWKDRYNIDFRLNKSIIMKSLNAGIFIDVNNVLNTKFLSYAGFSDYYDYLDYIESLNFPWEEGVEHGNDRVGEYRDWDVKYDPLEHNLDNEPDIAARNADRKRTKSYIDMPNIKAFTFLNPIKITFGFTIHF